MDADRQAEKAQREAERRRLAMAIMKAEAERKAGSRFEPLMREDERKSSIWGVRG